MADDVKRHTPTPARRGQNEAHLQCEAGTARSLVEACVNTMNPITI